MMMNLLIELWFTRKKKKKLTLMNGRKPVMALQSAAKRLSINMNLWLMSAKDVFLAVK